ncbi:flavin reductase family protein [Saccharothrix variisporea]|uniref:Flavin reductase (DIM6/NTAB) family NADH-FMN oxidoreductase RutF n=1 Tax=Saccharothrix variisporea TaxID=543527 RepID=A0A495X1A5_9PSEU|nr:flavin reductase family protein [Saccharothrix variisporea]RKT66994.1 flavin reductase (DIM6/NTAB) family NADH-FMN oxidoreductase RutF [Saccharothrix variisporea]
MYDAVPTMEETSLREAMSRFATGVTVLTVGGEHAHGMTANSFTSVSLDPPLVLCCVARTAVMHEAISGAKRFAVSVMGADQERTARYFADKRRPRGPAQFDVVDWLPGDHTGAPLLSGSLAWLECELAQWYEGGDHTIFLGRVLSCRRGAGTQALLFYGSAFHQV